MLSPFAPAFRRMPILVVFGLGAAFLGACAVGKEARMEEEGPQKDPLVRESVLGRIDEILQPLAERRATLKQDELRKDDLDPDACKEVCGLVHPFCDASSRVCDLASDFKGDSEITDRCAWAGSDCQEARGACSNCGGSVPED